MADTSDPNKEYLESQRLVLRQQILASQQRTAQQSRGFFSGRQLRAGGTGLDPYGVAPFSPPPDSPPSPPPPNPPPNPPPPNPPPNPPPKPPKPPNNPPPPPARPPAPPPKGNNGKWVWNKNTKKWVWKKTGGGNPPPRPPNNPPPPPRPPGGCFVAGTIIDTPDGERAIETIETGDVVWTIDPATRERSEGIVTDTHLHEMMEEPRFVIVLEDGRRIEATATHPFFHPACGEFHPLDHFHAGDRVLDVDADTGLSDEVMILSVTPRKGAVDEYNFDVEPHHNYIVSGILVHNPKGSPGRAAVRVNPATKPPARPAGKVTPKPNSMISARRFR